MTYRTILTVLDQSPNAERRTALAISLAQRFDAHLIGLAPTGVAALPIGDSLGVSGEFLADVQQRLDAAAAAAVESF